MKRTLAVLLVGAALLVAKATVSRATLLGVEKSINGRLEHVVEEPFVLLGLTRGIYLENYGAIFTAEVNLVPSAALTPFRQTMPKPELAKLKQKKMERINELKSAMRMALMASAASLDTVPANEQVVLGVSLFHHPHEDISGLPSQIVMQGERKALVELQTGIRDKSTADTVIRTQEF